MSTVDTLINATAAIYINDVHRPIKKFISSKLTLTDRETDRRELYAARVASTIITTLGVLSVLVFREFPTVYEAHGYFHSTLTPPLVIAIFLGIFWRRFTPSAVIATFLGGVALMILGANYPGVLIAPFDHGIEMNPVHPYSYIRALYNLFVCLFVAVLITLTASYHKRLIEKIRGNQHHRRWMIANTSAAVFLFLIIVFNKSLFQIDSSDTALVFLMVIISLVMTILVTFSVTYYVKYDENQHQEGLTIWTVDRAKELFKGRKINDREGEKVTLKWMIKEGDEDTVNLSKNDMEKMSAEVGDLVYLCDIRSYLGGLKSIHSTIGEPHNEEGIVYITDEHQKTGVFVKNKPIYAEKEM
jgi:SSS family solute:Na+ symporter